MKGAVGKEVDKCKKWKELSFSNKYEEKKLLFERIGQTWGPS